MNKTNIYLQILLISFLIGLSIQQKAEVITSTSKYSNDDYYHFYRIPINSKNVEANGDSTDSNPLKNAFDCKDNTYWQSNGANGEVYQRKSGEKIDLINSVTITLPRNARIDRIIYQAYSPSSGRFYGYPSKLEVSYKKKGDTTFTVADVFTSTGTDKRMLFTLSNSINCIAIRLKWLTIESNYSRKIVTAKEIALLLATTYLEIDQAILDLFDKSDYMESKINSKYSLSLLKLYKDYSNSILVHSTFANDFLDKAIAIAEKTYTKVKDREFSTNPNAMSLSMRPIKRIGDIDAHAKKYLKMKWVGTNRQSTGIYGISNSYINIYVQADSSDPLPSIRITQYQGHWRNWLGPEIKLKRGKNVIVIDEFDISDYENKVNPACPIYLINPYETTQQSANVKIYFEGGVLFPTFISGDGKSQFINKLKDYVTLYQNNLNTHVDIVEFVGQRVMITVPATKTYNVYKSGTYDPEGNLNIWDEYLKTLFTFDGVQFVSNQPYFHTKNKYANIHIRYAQPYGGAYAFYEHIGFFYDDWMEQGIYAKNKFGWGFPHEIGHMMEIEDREVTEITNNVISKYSDTYLEKEGTFFNDVYPITIDGLTRDDIDPLERGCTKSNKNECNGLFHNQQYLVTIYWDLESFYPGYWTQLENYYRFNITGLESLSRTERFIYVTCRILKLDLRYYFQRWGFSIGNEAPFIIKNSGSSFNTKFPALITDKILDMSKPHLKYWYLDYKEHNLKIDGKVKSCSQLTLNIASVTKLSSGVQIKLPTSSCSNHLGYEIYEHDKLIGFTHENTYTDKNTYSSSYSASYKIIAYDRNLKEYSTSTTKKITLNDFQLQNTNVKILIAVAIVCLFIAFIIVKNKIMGKKKVKSTELEKGKNTESIMV